MPYLLLGPQIFLFFGLWRRFRGFLISGNEFILVLVLRALVNSHKFYICMIY